MDTTEIDDAKYVSMTTYKKDGTAVPSPMWIAKHGTGFAVMTQSDSYKVKRLRNNPDVELAVSDAKGNIASGATRYSGKAKLLDGSSGQAAIDAVVKKYGIQAKGMNAVMSLTNKIKGKKSAGRIGIEIELGWSAGS